MDDIYIKNTFNFMRPRLIWSTIVRSYKTW